MALEQGDRVGRYEILGPLGAGGMGELYRARDRELGRDVAIKVLPDEVAADPSRLDRFRREARAVARLSHPNIVEIHDFANEGSTTYAVMELLEGEDLRARGEGASIGARLAAEIGAAVAEALAAAHAAGVIHRDLKPENIFLTADGRVKVLDFGIARLDVAADAPVSNDTPTLTSTHPGVVLGTVGYMSPEQVRGEVADHRSDIFSLGCVLYELLAGKRAFRLDTAAETMTAILSHDPPAPETLNVESPPELSRVVMRCLAKRPVDRFQSAQDLAFALREHSSASSPITTAPESAVDDRPSIAVLPFANLSADPEQEFFCDGMAEEIINALAHVEGLRVVARTSAFAFKGRHEDIREIGARLDVAHVLEGSVRKAGDRLRITAQLIKVADGYHLWSERFDRKLEDVFAIQDEISLAVVDRLKVRLLGAERAAIVKRYTENLEALSAFLKGVHHWNKLTPEGYELSRKCYQDAIRIDSGYAPAHVMLAVWYLSQSIWATLPPQETLAEGLPLIDKALAIDERIAEAHAIHAVHAALFERDRESAERSFRRAVELGPNSPAVRGNYCAFLLLTERFDEMHAEARLTKRLDPLSPTWNAWASSWIASSGWYEEGLAELEKLVAMDPNHWLPYHELALQYFRGSRLDDALAHGEKAVELSGGVSAAVMQHACLSYLAGNRERGDELSAQLDARSRESYVSPSFLAWIRLARGEIEPVEHLLEEAARIKDPWLGFLRLLTPSIIPPGPQVDGWIEKYCLPTSG